MTQEKPVFGEWKPIETAPKNGKDILVCLSDQRICIAYWVTERSRENEECDLFDEDCRNQHDWDEEEGCCYAKQGWVEEMETQNGEYFINNVTPIHWMPLPEPPKEDKP